MLIRVSACFGMFGCAAAALAQHAPVQSLGDDIAQHLESQDEIRLGTPAATAATPDLGRSYPRMAGGSVGDILANRARRTRTSTRGRAPQWTNQLEVDDRLPNAIPKSSKLAIQTWARISNMRDVRIFEAFRKTYGPVSPLLARLARERIAELNADEAELSAVVPPRSYAKERLNPANCKDVAVTVGTGIVQCVVPGAASFKDCAFCPEMVVVPSGSFVMGSPRHEHGRRADEKQLRVTIEQPFAVGKFAITHEEFAAFAKATRLRHWDPNCMEQAATIVAQTDRHPIVCVSRRDARAYVAWLSKTVGLPYRLLSEAEFEYAARAGTTTPYWWGREITRRHARYSARTGRRRDGGRSAPHAGALPVGSFEANAWGLFDVHGNVWQWTSGRSAKAGVLRGGSWRSPAAMLRAANRRIVQPGQRSDEIGFRVARTLRD